MGELASHPRVGRTLAPHRQSLSRKAPKKSPLLRTRQPEPLLLAPRRLTRKHRRNPSPIPMKALPALSTASSPKCVPRSTKRFPARWERRSKRPASAAIHCEIIPSTGAPMRTFPVHLPDAVPASVICITQLQPRLPYHSTRRHECSRRSRCSPSNASRPGDRYHPGNGIRIHRRDRVRHRSHPLAPGRSNPKKVCRLEGTDKATYKIK